MKKLLGTSIAAIALIATLSAAVAPDRSVRLHFALSKSSPEAGATVTSPSEIRLWFTQEPQEGTTQIRLIEAEEIGVHVMDVAQDADDPTSFYIELHGTLPAGTYTVSWRGMGDDGHVVRDSFEFTVSAQ
ncbi:MAG: copper resistance protein CopC [Gemmatimonadota bacterium]|nr:copper resistance protein CopC [Gemmatimonadota bacterium]